MVVAGCTPVIFPRSKIGAMILRNPHINRVVILKIWSLRIVCDVAEPRICRGVISDLDIVNPAALDHIYGAYWLRRRLRDCCRIEISLVGMVIDGLLDGLERIVKLFVRLPN